MRTDAQRVGCMRKVIIAIAMAAAMLSWASFAETVEDYASAMDIVASPATPEDNASLLDAYIASLFCTPGDEMLLSADYVGSGLDGRERLVYYYLSDYIGRVAAGEETSSSASVPLEYFTDKTIWTADELGVADIYKDGAITSEAKDAVKAFFIHDKERVMQALLHDCPYELYWYDKVSGCGIGPVFRVLRDSTYGYKLQVTRYAYTFSVAQAYAGEEKNTVKVEGVAAAKAAVQNARDIVDEHAHKQDYDKLLAYRNEICRLVSYNYGAIHDGLPYGDPWQLVYVFDNDSNTNVVCEGYSKAFQYLYELSEFENDVSSIIVEGSMNAGSKDEPHMWNVVRMENGKNYLVDVTNCDTGGEVAYEALFLSGYSSGDISSGYTVDMPDSSRSITYAYSEKTRNRFPDSKLILSDLPYSAERRVVFAVPDGVVTIEAEAFMGISAGIVVIPETCETIGYRAFANCENLMEVHILSEGTQIDPNAFEGCDGSLEIIYGR